MKYSRSFIQNLQPRSPEKGHPPLVPSKPPLKIEVLSSSPLFENVVGGSTPPPPQQEGGVHTMLRDRREILLQLQSKF